MNKKLLVISMSMALAVLACQKPPVAQKADSATTFPVAKGEGKEYQLDLQKSQLKWIGTKITGQHNGTVKLKNGSLWAKEGKITGGRFVADMNTIEVLDQKGESKAKLERHLRTEDFFTAEKYPEAIFEISSVEISPNGHTVKGNFTIRGIVQGVQFDTKIAFEKGTPRTAKANFNIDRKKWGIVYKGKPDDLISDTINLDLTLAVN